ncbi:hypothetical protein FQR65_LT10830 [Abscondita terminalis]|nr:hypothetical protein FQR65_LT10830 [Abscondita terminalis]
MSTHLTEVQISNEAVVISEPHQTHLVKNYESLINNSQLWHKVFIYTNGPIQKSVLSIIMDYVHPFDFIPVCFCVEYKNVSFFIRNCSKAIHKLCEELLVPNPQSKYRSFKLSVTLGYCNTSDAEVKVEDNILKVVTKRYSASSKYLKLDNFDEDPGLTEFCALSQPQILNYVLFLCRKFEVCHLSLRYNKIYSLKRIKEFSNMKQLKLLDLRNNLIEDVSELSVFADLNISSLYLGINPLCSLYTKDHCITLAKKEIPSLKVLDGVKATVGVTTHCNFICNMEAHELVDQFLSHYFSIYDSRVRDLLSGVYDENATFSFTSAFKPSDLAKYVCCHLLRLVTHNFFIRKKGFLDFRRADKCVITGSENIIKVLNGYAKCNHDPYTFTVDVIYYSDETVILTVTGRLRQLASFSLGSDAILHFARTFVLNKRLYNEYKIVNDIWLVTPPTILETAQPFEVPRYITGQEVKPIKLVKMPSLIASTDTDKDFMVSTFAKIATTNLDWSRRLRFKEIPTFFFQTEEEEARGPKNMTVSTNSLESIATEKTTPTTSLLRQPVKLITSNHLLVRQESPLDKETNLVQKKKRVYTAARKLKRKRRTVRIRDITGNRIRMLRQQAVELGVITSTPSLGAL